MTAPQEVLEYWFGSHSGPDDPGDRTEMWWKKNPSVDAEIRARFEGALEASARGALDHWRETREGRLAHIILVDQMARNMHRGSADMYAQDDLAQELALLCAISDSHYAGYYERMFQYMPFMHAENVALQRLCVHLFAAEIEAARSDAVRAAAKDNHGFAVQHLKIVERFGRFPHRNALLGRVSSDEELAFLEEPGSSF